MLMPILRLVLIYLVLVAAVVAVFNRDRLAPLLPGGRDRVAEAEAHTAAPDTTRMPATEPDTVQPAQPETPAAAQPAAVPVYPDAAATDLANAPAAAAALQTLQPPVPGTPAPLGTPVADPAAAPAPAVQTPQPAAPTAPTAPPQPAAAPTAPDTLTASIAEARAAYWAGDIAGARTRMLALYEAHPDNPDVAGELGNLAFALRDYPAAAEAWARAGALLINRGEGARVMSFLPILQSIAPDKAAALAARLQDG